MNAYYRSFKDAIDITGKTLIARGKEVDTGRWQGVDVSGKPDMVSFEVLNHSFTCAISPDIKELKEQIKPNLPWADDHFLERVGGVGLNPGNQYNKWPHWNPKSEQFLKDNGGKFTHSYMERIWPNDTEKALERGHMAYDGPHLDGIRYPYGDLNDVVTLLRKEPLTRQAFLPIWYPEDTGAKHGGRVPCTLGYHFMLRDGQLHMWYPIRSCDYIRHFRDDIYMACRLVLWVLDQLKDSQRWKHVRPGKLTMQIYSLHIFASDLHTWDLK